LQYKFHPEIPTGSPRAGASNNGGLRPYGKQDIFVVLTLSLGGCQTFYRSYFKRIRQVAALSCANRGVSCAFLFRPGDGSPSAINVVLWVVVIRISIPRKSVISQPIVMKLFKNINDKNQATVAEF